MNVVDCIQGDSVWFKCRLGCVTSSRIADVVAKRKKSPEEMACRRDMRYEILGELLTKKASEHYVSRWMKEGKEKEADARNAYQQYADVLVEEVGYVYHPRIKMAGASPDGLVGDDGLIEIKCPKLDTHLSYLMEDVIPEDYLPQMIWQLASCEREWIDFVSFHPDMPEPDHLFIKRLHRSTKEIPGLIGGYEAETEYFLSEVDVMFVKVKERVREALQVSA